MPATSLSLSPSKAADFLGVGRTKMLDLIRSGRVEARTLDGRIRVDAASVQAFFDALPDYDVANTRAAILGPSLAGIKNPSVTIKRPKAKAKRRTRH